MHRSMKMLAALAAGVLLVLVLAVPAFAESPEQRCEDLGGTYSKDRGTASCVISETPGNNQGGVTKDTTESQKGSFTSSHEEESARCVNNSGGVHCPSGQQGGGDVLPI